MMKCYFLFIAWHIYRYWLTCDKVICFSIKLWDIWSFLSLKTDTEDIELQKSRATPVLHTLSDARYISSDLSAVGGMGRRQRWVWCCVSSHSVVSDIRSTAGRERCSPCSSHLTQPSASLSSQTCLSVILTWSVSSQAACYFSTTLFFPLLSLCLSLISCLHLPDDNVSISFCWKQVTLKMTHMRNCKC